MLIICVLYDDMMTNDWNGRERLDDGLNERVLRVREVAQHGAHEELLSLAETVRRPAANQAATHPTWHYFSAPNRALRDTSGMPLLLSSKHRALKQHTSQI